MNRPSRRILAVAALLLALALPRAAAAACSVTTGDFDGNGLPDLKITANTAKQTLILDVEASQVTVTLDCSGDGDFVDTANGDLDHVVFPGSFYTLDLELGGADVITVNFPTSAVGLSKDIAVLFGPGNNIFNMTAAPGVTLTNSKLMVDVSGYINIDKLNVTLPGFDNSALVFRSDLSTGNDEAYFTLGGDVVNGSVLDIDVALAIGSNKFGFTFPGTRTIADSTLLVNAEGSSSVDIVTSQFDGVLSGNTRVYFNADLQGGNDKFTGNFNLGTFRILSGAEGHFNVDGGLGTDTIAFTRNGTTGGNGVVNAGLLDLRLAGGAQDDSLTVDLAGGGFEMNGGTLSLRASGGAGNDKINVLVDAAPNSSNPNFDVAINGGTQNDTITFALNNNSASNSVANYGPAGFALVDGSFGLNVVSATLNGGTSPFLMVRNPAP